MEIEFTVQAYKELEYWRKTGNAKVLKRIAEITESILQTPFLGLGKPEALKYEY
ncbi:YoeB-like toxin of type II toxin-antitoxin system [Arcticibacter pallidicorallinus]|uniref:YoeB-like toxin of type II toxin-antitoxin system n=1 Tax=Arcticibacter pallidicorallinus TaxID=1259464 RepID=A0A2T0U712_9SPHI|nr:YoeB-like toxin of type II toxin-antitoxin system [Arcticibacter pallidicorallinus]